MARILLPIPAGDEMKCNVYVMYTWLAIPHKPPKKSVYVMQSVGLKRCEIVQHVDIVTELFILRFGYFSTEYVVVEKCGPPSGRVNTLSAEHQIYLSHGLLTLFTTWQ